MRKLMTLVIAMLLTAATQGQVVDGRHISIPASGLPSVVTILTYCSHGYDETVTFVPAGFLGMMVFFSVSDESVRLSEGKLVGDESIKAEGGNVNGHTNIYWLQCPPFPDVRNTYGVVVDMHDNDGYAGQIVVEIDVYPEGMTEDNSTQHGSWSSGHTNDYIYPRPIFGPDVIRHSFGGDLYIAGEYIPEKLRGTKKREDRPPYEYANLRKLPMEFPKEEFERKEQYLREHENKH